MLRSAVFLATLAAVSCQTTTVSRCTDYEGDLPINTYIEGCETPPCALPQLQDVVVHIIFEAPYTMRTMRTMATAYLNLGFIQVPIRDYDLGDNRETCNFLNNSYCPILKGEVLDYTLKMYIEPFFPINTSVNIEFRLEDEFNVGVYCIRVGLRIVAPIEDASARTTNGTVIVNRI